MQIQSCPPLPANFAAGTHRRVDNTLSVRCDIITPSVDKMSSHIIEIVPGNPTDKKERSPIIFKGVQGNTDLKATFLPEGISTAMHAMDELTTAAN